MSELDGILAAGNQEETFTVDFSGASEDNDFSTPLAAGEYAAVVEKVETGTSKAGNPKIVWVFKVTEGARKGKQVWGHYPTTGNTFRNKQVLSALGVDGPNFSKAQVLGKAVTLVIGDPEEDSGFDNLERVKAASPASLSALG